MYATDTNDAPETKATEPEMNVPAGLAEALPELIDDAIDHMEAAFIEKQEEMTEFYKGDLPGITKEDLDDGRSDIVSRDVHDAFMATAPDLLRAFLGPEHIVQFEPGSPDDEETAPQATDGIRYIFEKENDAFRLVYGSLKDGLIRKYAVAHWYHEHVDKSFTKDYTLLEDELAAFIDSEKQKGHDAEVISAEALPDGTVKAKVRHVRHVHRFIVDLVPPEELYVSRSARNARGEHLIGRRRNLPKQKLIQMGISEELLETAGTRDATVEDNALAQERTPDGNVSGSDRETEEALYCESYLEWADGEKMQLFKVCTLGNGYEIVACEPVDEVDLAVFTPDPEPHTVIGESQAEKVADIQRLKTGIWRGIVDSLAEALVPRTEIVEGQVNIEDAMSTEIGGLVRVRTPNTVRPISTPFLGQQAVPLLEAVDVMREERVGAFRASDGLTGELMQSASEEAVEATTTGSKSQKEVLARVYAETFLKPIFRGLLRLFVQHQDKPKMMKLRGKWVPVDPASWNADMDCSVDVAEAMQTNREKAGMLGAVAEKQEQIIGQMGPVNPLCNLGHYSRTLRELVRLTGRKNVDAYFAELPTDPQALAQVLQQNAQFQPPQAPDPAMVLAQAQVTSLQNENLRKDAEAVRKADFEERKHADEMDFNRDKLAQDKSLKLLEIAATTGAKTAQTEAAIEADIAKNRDNLVAQMATGAADRDAQAVQHQTDLQHQSSEADKDRQVDGQRHLVDTVAKDSQHQRDTDAADQRHQRDTASADQRHEKSLKAQSQQQQKTKPKE